MLACERLAEEKIRDAIAAGEFDNLPGKGKPLDLGEPPGMRPEDRLGYLVLKNGRFLPEYLQLPFWALKNREQNLHLWRGKRVQSRTLSQRLNRLNQTYREERRWLRERLSETASQIEDTVQHLQASMVEKEIRERREFLLLRQSPHFSRRERLAQFDREFPATFPERNDRL